MICKNLNYRKLIYLFVPHRAQSIYKKQHSHTQSRLPTPQTFIFPSNYLLPCKLEHCYIVVKVLCLLRKLFIRYFLYWKTLFIHL